MDAHEVKTETVDVVLTCPVANGLYHEAAVHLMVGSGLVTATGTIRVGAILAEAVEILRYYTSKGAAHDIVSVVVNDIHDDTNTGFVERLDHLFRLANTASRIVGVGGITAVRYVVVHRVISPVVFILFEGSLVNGAVVKHRQDLEVGNTEFAQVVECRFFRHSEELPFVDNTGVRRYRIIANVGLVHDNIRRIGHGRTNVFIPAFGVGSFEIEDRGTLAVYRNCFGKDTRRFGCPLAILEGTNGIVFAGQIAFDGSCPEIVLSFGKGDYFELSGIGSLIEMNLHLFGYVGPKSELGFGRTIEALVLHFGSLGSASD